MKKTLILAAMGALLLAGCAKKGGDAGAPTPSAGPIAAVPPPAGKQWTDVVSQTPDGGVRMGNPDAPVKLVEYASFTCPHCKHFEETGSAALEAKYVRTGKVSWEFRSTLIHAQDAPITMLMNCRGADPFFPLTEQLYAQQDAIVQKFVNAPQAEMARIAALPPLDNMKAQAELGGLYGFFGARGLPKAQAQACLSDQKNLDQLTAAQNKIQEAGVNQTPTFAINGENQTASDWEQLEPLLSRAVG